MWLPRCKAAGVKTIEDRSLGDVFQLVILRGLAACSAYRPLLSERRWNKKSRTELINYPPPESTPAADAVGSPRGQPAFRPRRGERTKHEVKTYLRYSNFVDVDIDDETGAMR